MSFFNRLFSKRKEIAPLEGYCPNCWGVQEYQDKMISAAEKERIDMNNIGQKKGWIQAYAAQNLNSIKLNPESEACPACTKLHA